MHILGWIVPPRSLTPRFTCLYTFRSYLNQQAEDGNQSTWLVLIIRGAAWWAMRGLSWRWCSLLGNERIVRWTGLMMHKELCWDTCMNERRWCCLRCIWSNQIDRWPSEFGPNGGFARTAANREGRGRVSWPHSMGETRLIRSISKKGCAFYTVF
jgi:hypothetical protein